jgi:phage terminase large subunit
MTTMLKKIKIRIPKAFSALFSEFWRYIIFYGGRGSGKSQSVARALLIRGRQKKLRILCTREIQNTIKDSVHKLLKDIIEEYEFTDYQVTNDSIINQKTGTEFLFKGLKHHINEIKSTEGIDICWVEEAQSVSKQSLDVLTPTIRKPGSQIIFTFNRQTELDPVYVEFVQNRPPKTYVKKVNYDVLEKLGLLPDVLIEEREKDRKDAEVFAHKWLGEPESQNELSILSRTAILAAMQREVSDDGLDIYGVDVARMGNDKIVFWHRKGLATKKFKAHRKLKTTQTCDALEVFVGFNKEAEIRIDDTGVGGGVTDEMEKRGYNVVPVNFGSKAHDEDKYPNWISEAWFYIQEIIEEIQLPYNSELLQELSNRQWHQDKKGKRQVESKQEYKKRGYTSPDMADACIICYGPVFEAGIMAYLREQAAANTEAA